MSVSPPPPPQSNPRILQQLQSKMRLGHYSLRTAQAYAGWVVRFVRFHRLRHPRELGEREVAAFLIWLAEERGVAASTQVQAQAALVYFYREVLDRPLHLDRVVPRARGPTRIPVVLDVVEVRRVLEQLQGVYSLIGLLLYGGGLRLMECLTLRVKDVDLVRYEIRVRRGKGQKDRVTMLPEAAAGLLGAHLVRVKALHDKALQAGTGTVQLPGALARKYPRADRSWPWQWIFPAKQILCGAVDGGIAPASPASIGGAAGHGRGGQEFGYWEAGKLPHAPALVRDAPAGGGATTSGRCRNSWAIETSARR